jgi:hypothetical protein
VVTAWIRRLICRLLASAEGKRHNQSKADLDRLSCLSAAITPVVHCRYSFLSTMLKRVKEKFQRSRSSKSSQSEDSRPSGTPVLNRAVSAVNRLADVCSCVSILIPGLKDAVDVATQVVKVAEVRRSYYPLATKPISCFALLTEGTDKPSGLSCHRRPHDQPYYRYRDLTERED